MTRVLVRYDVDMAAARDAARGSGNQLPPATTCGMVDCGRAVIATWDPETRALKLRGPQVKLTLPHLKAFTVEVLP